jgi:transposase
VNASANTRPAGRKARGAAASATAGTPSSHHARHRLLKASERLGARERGSLCALFEREPLLAEAWGLKEAFRSIYKAQDRAEAQQRLQRFYTAVDHAHLRPFTAFANGLTDWQTEMLAYFDEPTTNGNAEGVINKVKIIQTPRLRTAHLRRLPQTRPHSLWLTGQHDATPLNQQEPKCTHL